MTDDEITNRGFLWWDSIHDDNDDVIEERFVRMIREFQHRALTEAADELARVQRIGKLTNNDVTNEDLNWYRFHPLNQTHYSREPLAEVEAWLHFLAGTASVNKEPS